MLTVGDRFPSFSLKATVSERLDTAFETITNETHAGKWLVVFFWPKDFTFVCPTEIAEFGRKNGEFADRDAQVLGASVDSEFVHLAWRKDHKDLTGLPFPMLSDLRKDLSSALGILDEEGVAKRATFIVDPQGVIRFASVTDMNVGRNVDEVVRVLDALQTDELCPCNWQRGDETLKAA
jgi:peroxiredoxin (alkyl hydroperoxide reductase subunit C)